MKRRSRRVLNSKGLTLVEVMVAITILLLAAEIISISVTFTARMNTRSREIANANEEVGKKIMTEGVSGTMSIRINGSEVSNSEDEEAWMYSEKAGKNADGFQVNAMWADDSIMTDLYKVSGAEALPLSDKPEGKTLPDEFPTLENSDGLHEINPDEYVGIGEDEENGTIIFRNQIITNRPSFVYLDGRINISASGKYTSSGITVMIPGDIFLGADRISLWMEAEVYYLYGEIQCNYSEKYRDSDSIPIHLYMVPESGHKQPALVYIEEGTVVKFNSVSEDGVETLDTRRTYMAGSPSASSEIKQFIQPGWYAIPSDVSGGSLEEQQANAKDLLRISPEEWEDYRLTDTNSNLKAGAMDMAYARLILAGVIDSPRTSEDDNLSED